MQSDLDYRPVLAGYPDQCQPSQVEYLGSAGGFSGARFWRLTTPCGLLCLRAWPREHPSSERLEFIQAVLWHVRQEGVLALPLPLETHSHSGYVRHEARLWELTPWMPGAADYHAAPTPEKLDAAMTALARFHVAAASFPLPESRGISSQGIEQRTHQLRELLSGRFEELSNSIRRGPCPGLHKRAERVARLFPLAAQTVLSTLENCQALEVPRQPCIRDIWHDHVLFVGQEVSSFVDFGAMRAENVSTDVARLLGSLARDDCDGWQRGLSAYEAVRSLSEAEVLLVTAFDRSTVLLSGLSWIEWIYVQNREFENRQGVLDRMDEIVARLEFLVRPD